MTRGIVVALCIWGLNWPASAEAYAPPDTADRLAQWQPFITEAGLRFGVPTTWITRVMRAESAGQTTRNGRPITSDAGAMGLMQLMPGTYEEMRLAYHLGPDPFDPHDNILAGTAYLRTMFDRFGYPGLFAAYNVGPTRFEASLRGVTLPKETRDYLLKVVEEHPETPTIPALFVPISEDFSPTMITVSNPIFAFRLTPDAMPEASPDGAPLDQAVSAP